MLALNFCIKKNNNLQKEYYFETLDLYKKGLSLELLLENDKLSRSTFTNIVGIALRIDNTEWVENFIQTYRKHLSAPYNITAYNLNMVRLEFVKKNYRKALIHLQDAGYDDLLNHMTAKILQMKIYYELEEFETLFSLLKSTRAFIRRKKSIGYHYKYWKNTIRYVQKIMNTNPYDKKTITQLKDAIQDEERMIEKEWMLEKLGEV